MIYHIDSIIKNNTKYKFIDSNTHKQLQYVAEQISQYTEELSDRIVNEMDFISEISNLITNSHITTNLIENNEYELSIKMNN